MKRNKRFLYVVVPLLILSVWYLLIKRDDYIIQFEIGTAPGSVMSSIEEWNREKKRENKFDYQIVEKKPFAELQQTIQSGSEQLVVYWNISSINDSVSKVRVGLSQKENSVRNRLTVPFSMTEFKKKSLALVKEFKLGMERDLKERFKVHTIGRDTLPGFQFAYLKVENVRIQDKAKMMMQTNGLIISFLNTHKIERTGFPIIVVDRWDRENNLIDFKLGFPIVRVDSFPDHPNIKMESKGPSSALRAIYNGNYRSSDRAWYYLDEYANNHGIGETGLPVEIFYNNPFLGGNELEWKAAVFVPVGK